MTRSYDFFDFSRGPRMNGATLIRTAILLASPLVVAAQSDARPGSVFVSAGIGSGEASFSCNACASQRDAGLSGLLRVGVALSPRIALSAEASGWTKKYADAQGSAAARFLFADLAAQWYPWINSGGFVKAGGGIATIEDDITVSTLGETAIATTGPALLIGAGWDVPVTSRWAVTPYVDINRATKSRQSINGVRGDQMLGGSVVHFGIAATRGSFVPRRPAVPLPPIRITPLVSQDSIDRARIEQARLDSIGVARAGEMRVDSLARVRAAHEERDRLVADSNTRVREAEVAAVREAVRFAIVTAIFFDVNKADLRADARQALDAKLPLLLTNADVIVRIAGHTDLRGSGEDNQWLGEHRAAAARAYLIAHGVSATRIEIVNFGKDRPVCTSRDEACLARNRRAEFEIIGGGTALRKP